MRRASKKVPLHSDVKAYLESRHGMRFRKDLAFFDKRRVEELVVHHSRQVVTEALSGIYDGCDTGVPWPGPPFDLRLLASFLGHEVIDAKPTLSDDAELHPIIEQPGSFRIYCNPDCPVKRQNFSIAHELGHTIIPPPNGQLRTRLHSEDPAYDFLERLCNLAAAEFLLPFSVFSKDLKASGISYTSMVALSELYTASYEAVGRRMITICDEPVGLAIFSMKLAPRQMKEQGQGFLFYMDSPKEKLRVDYCYCNNSFKAFIPQNKSVPEDSPLLSVHSQESHYRGMISIHKYEFQAEAFCVGERVFAFLHEK